MRAGRVYQRRNHGLRQRQKSASLVCRCPVPVCPCWPDSARPLSRKSLEMARCRRRWSDFWQTPDPPPACDTPMAWNYPAMIGRLPRCLRRGPQGRKKRDTLSLSHSHSLTHTASGQGALPREEPARPFPPPPPFPPTLFPGPPPRYLRQPQRPSPTYLRTWK